MTVTVTQLSRRELQQMLNMHFWALDFVHNAQGEERSLPPESRERARATRGFQTVLPVAAALGDELREAGILDDSNCLTDSAVDMGLTRPYHASI